MAIGASKTYLVRPSLSSKDTFTVFDNAKFILGPPVGDAQEIYKVVEELSQLNNVCRISPPPRTSSCWISRRYQGPHTTPKHQT